MGQGMEGARGVVPENWIHVLDNIYLDTFDLILVACDIELGEKLQLGVCVFVQLIVRIVVDVSEECFHHHKVVFVKLDLFLARFLPKLLNSRFFGKHR